MKVDNNDSYFNEQISNKLEKIKKVFADLNHFNKHTNQNSLS